MADYSAPANWAENEAPNGTKAVADLSKITTDGVFVKLPTSLTLATVKGADYSIRPVLVGDGTLVFNRTDNSSAAQRVQLYTDISMNNYPWKLALYQTDVCGDFSVYPYYFSSGDVNFRADRYAKSSNPVRETPWSSTGKSVWYFGSNKTVFYAPCGSDEPVSATWTLVNGSPFAVRSAGQAGHALCAGTIVTVAGGAAGASLPSGTFLKRIFPDGSIELSEAAVLDAATAEVPLTFAAFAPKLHQHVYRFFSDGTSTIRLAKYREQDEFRLEIDQCWMTSNRTFGTPEGFFPGTFVLHEVQDTAGKTFTLETTHIEFAPRVDSGTPGYAGKITFKNSQDTKVRFTVTNGVSAVVGSFANLPGTVVKDGSGVLSVGITNDFSTASGKIVVEEGTLAVLDYEGCVDSAVPTLAVSNGATLKLPQCGLRCMSFIAEPGATVSGPGLLVVPDVAALENVTLTDGATVVTHTQFSIPAGGYTYDAPMTNVVGNPAIWVDASRPETMALVEAGAYKGVARWSDVRGGEYMYLTNNGAHYPSLITNTSGEAKHVYIPKSTFRDGGDGSADITNTFAMSFSDEIRFRHIFQVMNAREGCGQFLGRNIAGYPYSRAAGSKWSDALFNSEYKDDSIQTNIPFYVNGCRKSVKDGFAYPGGYASTNPGDLLPFVSELHPGAISRTIDVGNIGFARYPDRDGNVRMYECIVYTNALTAVEIEQVRGYLMKKWLNSEIDHDRYQGTGGEALADIMDGDARIAPPSGRAFVVESVSGAGDLAKTGGGELYVNDLADPARSVRVAQGRLIVRSMEQTMPGEPYFHGDASAEETVTKGASGIVSKWTDVRGDGYPVANSVHKNKTKYIANAVGKFGAINLGAYSTSNYHHDYAGFSLPECSDARTVFSVMDTSQGGGFLLGNDDPRNSANKVQYIVGAKMRGLYRIPESCSKAIVDKTTYWYGSETDAKSTSPRFAIVRYGPGATRAYLNGVSTNLTEANFSGGWDMVALASRDPIAVNGIGMGYYASYWRGGGQKIGEHVIYRETLCEENLLRAQAYLRQKWYGVATPGYRSAEVDAIEVKDGAALAIYGGAPVLARSLAGAGAVEGSVAIAPGGTLSVEIAPDGTLLLPSVSGTLSAEGDGRVILSGVYRSLGAGVFKLAEVAGDWSGWTVEFDDGKNHNRSISLLASNGALYLTVRKPGLIMIVK
jgi:hypothetical protein